MLFSPDHDGIKNRQRVLALPGEDVLLPGAAAVVVRFPLQQPVVHEAGQAFGEHGVGDHQPLLHGIEAAVAEEDFAEHQHAPGIAKDIEAARHGARALGPVRAECHAGYRS